MISKLTLALLFCVSLLLVGCGKSNPAVGSWKLDISPDLAKLAPKGSSMPTVVIDFKDDKTFSGSADFMGQKHTMEGTYTLEGKTLTMTTTKEDGKPPTNAKPETATISEDGKSMDMPGLKGMGKLVKQ